MAWVFKGKHLMAGKTMGSPRKNPQGGMRVSGQESKAKGQSRVPGPRGTQWAAALGFVDTPKCYRSVPVMRKTGPHEGGGWTTRLLMATGALGSQRLGVRRVASSL